MCNGFGMIVTNELNTYFCEPDSSGDCSHSEILKRLGWKDNANQFTRRFVRVQCPTWTMASFEFDENDTLPGWAEEHRKEIKSLVKKALMLCAPAYAEYQKVRAPAYAEYKKVRAPAEAEYQKVRAPAYAEYQKVCAPAYAVMILSMSHVPGYVAKVQS